MISARFEVYELPGDDDTSDVYCRDTQTGEEWWSRKSYQWAAVMREWQEKQIEKTKGRAA
jgi:hypothetical protein